MGRTGESQERNASTGVGATGSGGGEAIASVWNSVLDTKGNDFEEVLSVSGRGSAYTSLSLFWEKESAARSSYVVWKRNTFVYAGSMLQ